MNPITPDVEIEIRGKAYKLFFRHRDFAMAEYRLKQQGYDFAIIGPQAGAFWSDLIQAEDEEEGKPTVLKKFNTLYATVLLYVGLLRKNPRMTFDEAQDLIDFDNLSVLGEVVAAAAIAISRIAPPQPGEKEAAEPEAPLAPVSGGLAVGVSPESPSVSENTNSGN